MRFKRGRERQTGRSLMRWKPVMCLLWPVLVVIGCGGNPASPTVVRVGDAAITKEAVGHWARTIAHGVVPGGMRNESRGTPMQRALAFLISSASLRGEAAVQGVSPSSGAVTAALANRREANGAAEFEQSLHASGQTLDDVKLEVETELASAAVRKKALARAPAVSEADVHDFYRSHHRLFLIPEKRKVELLENLSSPAAARALVSRIGIGAAFSKKALHEELQINRGERLQPDIEHATHAAFRAPVGVVSEPVSLNNHWAVFVVRKITPASFKPLVRVRLAIEEHLTAEHRAATLATFTAAYRKRWTAKTNCHPGYVVQGCAQYTGPRQPEPNPFPGE
jgi:foldase protein PrsA